MRQEIAEQLKLLPERLAGHVFLSMGALAIGMLISIPLGIAASRRPKLEHGMLAVASVIQTVPSLALLALMVFAFGTIGWIPALIALILYSVLPLLRNTVIGLQEIDPAYIKAARGIGMDGWQQLWRVEIPLALPTIVAGIRTASVWVVGAATIAQPVGATSLGNYIFVGLQTFNMVSLLCGVISAAALALILDGTLMALQAAAKRRSVTLAVSAGCVTLLVIAGPLIMMALSNPAARQGSGTRATAEEEVTFIVGGKGFTEQYILAGLLEKRLQDAGYEVQVKDNLGSGIIFQALASGKIDCYIDYSGTLWTNQMKREEVQSRFAMNIDIATFLKQQYGILTIGTVGFSNDYVFAMRRADAEQRGIETLEDLAEKGSSLRLGTDIEFLGRPEWTAVRDRYGLDFAEKTSMDPNLMYGAIQQEQVDVITAFNTDGRILAYDLLVLEDSAEALPPYDALILVSPRMAKHRRAMLALSQLVNRINNRAMRAGNAIVDVDKKPIRDARDYLDRTSSGDGLEASSGR